MACSAIYFLDMKGKVLLHRNYRGDIENTVIDKFIGKNSEFSLKIEPISMRYSIFLEAPNWS